MAYRLRLPRPCGSVPARTLLRTAHRVPLFPVCVSCAAILLQDEEADLRQSAFALVGDYAKTCIVHMQPVLLDLVPVLAGNLNPAFVSVCNNACWALGEIVVRTGAALAPFVVTIMTPLVPIMNRSTLNRSLRENTAITIGRFGLVFPAVVAPLMPHFMVEWCVALRSVRDDIEKEQAFMGLCAMVQFNPAAVSQNSVALTQLIVAIAHYRRMKDELRQQLGQILHGLKATVPEWNAFYANFPQELRDFMAEHYRL